MPEGPEIRLAADKIEAVLKDKTAEQVEFGLAPLKRFTKPLTGSTVLSLETRGKALLTHFDSGYTIYSHIQLYGVWRVVKRDKLPKTNRQLRLAIHPDQIHRPAGIFTSRFFCQNTRDRIGCFGQLDMNHINAIARF